MSIASVLAPVFALVFLTFFLLIWMGRSRVAAVRAGQAPVPRGSPRDVAWPAKVQQVSDSFNNQFELPLLFYALVPLAILTRKADLLFVVMAWIFVALRFAHAYEHTGANRLRARFSLFLAGMIVLLAMWAIFAIRVLAGV